MKKKMALLAALCMIICVMSGCGSSTGGSSGKKGIDVDLASYSATIVYAEVSNMMTNPDDYIGKVVRMVGQFSYFHDDDNGNDYFSCIIEDATACCAQGIEFVLAGDYTYPDDYPEESDEIEVTGTFDTYYEGDYRYITLRDAVME